MTLQTKVINEDRRSTQEASKQATANYNSLKSSLVQFEEQASLTKFNTYSEIIIDRYTFDDINVKELNEMIQQLVALAEFSF